MPQQITIRELLKDPVYREWIKKVPQLGQLPTPQRPWRVYALAEPTGRWAKVDLAKYSEAYAWMRDNIRDFHDIVISCKRQGFKPPVVTYKRVKNPRTGVVKKLKRYHIPVPQQDLDTANPEHKHVWCPYCRRPTLFLWYKRHHAMRGITISPHERRCCVCGVRLTFIDRYESR